MAKKKPPKKLNKSAIDGKIVSNEDLKKHPKTTFRETTQPPKPKAPKRKSPKKA